MTLANVSGYLYLEKLLINIPI